MVVVEEAEEQSPGPDRAPAAVVITSAGWDAANGLYVPTGKTWHDAPVFENDKQCLLSREPHKNQKTGQTTFGWIIGQDRKPLYAIQSEGLTPPSTGWRKFNGTVPPPQLQALASVEEAARAAGLAWKEQGNTFFAAKKYEEAADKWTRALTFAGSSRDQVLEVALRSNRAEARIRQHQWEGALDDSQAALLMRPTHEKALLRATVAARELRRLSQAQDFAQRCVEAHPNSHEAVQLLEEVRALVEEASNQELAGRAKSARAKLQESIEREAATGDLSKIPKAFAAKDLNSKKGFQAFKGYAETRAKPEERPPLSSLPYHQMGLPPEQTEMMDKFFQEMRNKKDEQTRAAKETEKALEAMKKEYKEQAEQEIAEGRPLPSEEAAPSEKARRQLQEQKAAAEERKPPRETPKPLEASASAQARRKQAGPPALSSQETGEIDSLFAGVDGEAAPAPPAPAASDRRQRLEKARELLAQGGKDVGPSDRRTARERQLDAEEAEEKRQQDLKIRYELQLLKTRRNGEPTRFEQAAGEVYCWWKMPSQVSGREVKVRSAQGGTHMLVEARDVVIFDSPLFHVIKADDIVWSVDDGELHLTLTKFERNKLWEQLGQVSEVQRDDHGEVRVESLPEPLSAGERVSKFQEMVQGDDGVEYNYDDLDADAREFVDILRRYKHAQATGDMNALSLAEMELEELGKLVIE
eukprot:CAMPEP_0175492630 /NCGR_PEP_ID=MMETSP0096-20121207/2362_1 /TAXON_ID=311494 /ORGANISM="Alexandrium monilatum, Strain CCMP3105" /LENGTH=697 /DNA_ID=CAMNT_0016794561 /DNA_START=1 /DNA_END=2092 /DNA_ORIENTATION=+